MQEINSELELRNAIIQLEAKQVIEGKKLKEQFHLTYDSLKPVNLIKNIINETVNSPEIKNNLLNTSVGIGTGYLTKILFESVSVNPVKKILGSVLMFGISNLVTNNPETIKLIGNKLLSFISKKPVTPSNGIDINASG